MTADSSPFSDDDREGLNPVFGQPGGTEVAVQRRAWLRGMAMHVRGQLSAPDAVCCLRVSYFLLVLGC
ncbi:hypothetical protein E1A91_D04G199700v1 [Gossypium mustelinum]|uniref:Uncharacterized protein n=1 Tax=Gossypium mustelinum TaxID=34275 RepID=A0A5D2VG04_GOSMU|nr:hypothetical protein E1A91_D04G199700v1 [Gossypium mustelinum]